MNRSGQIEPRALHMENPAVGDDLEPRRRFYLRQQSPETICRELDLTETQFRLKKSRAKARLPASNYPMNVVKF
jgi:hypothetical protein